MATFLLGLRALNSALTAPYLGFYSRNGIENFENIEIGSRFIGLDTLTFGDTVSSVLVFGLPRTRVQFSTTRSGSLARGSSTSPSAVSSSCSSAT